MLALAEFETESCTGCGLHPSITEDPTNMLMPDARICRVCAGLDQFKRLQHARDEVAEKAAGDVGPVYPRPDDGRTNYLRPATQDEINSSKKGGEPRGDSRRTRGPLP